VSRAAYMRQYRATLRKTRGNADKRLIRRGAEDFRQIAIKTFREIGARELSGYTAVEILEQIAP